MSDEWRRWLGDAPAARPPIVYDPPHCPDYLPLRSVKAADFETDYDREIPESELWVAVRRFQRSRETAPFCPFHNTHAIIWWRKIGRFLYAFWVCERCYDRHGHMPMGQWFALRS